MEGSLLKLAKIFVQPGNVNLKNENSETALHVAAEAEDVSLIEYLVSLGADVKAKDNIDRTPLHQLCLNHHNQLDTFIKAAEILHNSGADVNALDTLKSTPLYFLTWFSRGFNRDGESVDPKIVEYYLQYNPDVNIRNEEGESPLFAAVLDENIDVAQLLIDHGSNVNSPDVNENTPLHKACEYRNLKMIKFLLKNGANINALEIDGRNPMMSLMFSNPSITSNLVKILEFLVQYQIFYVNVVDINGLNLLTTFSSDVNVWEIILEHLAKLHVLGLPVHAIFHECISNHPEFNDFYKACAKELLVAKNTKFNNSWVTFFDLLVNSRKKLKNFAGNKGLIKEFENSIFKEKFPIYGAEMQKNLIKSITRRELYDKSAEILSTCLPIFDSFHLIIRDVLDCLLSKKDLLKLSE